MTALHQDASFWGQLPGNEDSMKGKGVADLERAYKFIIKGTCAIWLAGFLTGSKADLSPASRGRSGLGGPGRLCPRAVRLAARYIKTGASVTESALWKLRGLADGHFWRCRSIIKMKSGDWAGLACSVALKSSHSHSSSALLLSLTGYLGSGRVGGKKKQNKTRWIKNKGIIDAFLQTLKFAVCAGECVCMGVCVTERKSHGLKKSI